MTKISNGSDSKGKGSQDLFFGNTPETRFSDPRFSEILDLVNKTQLHS